MNVTIKYKSKREEPKKCYDKMLLIVLAGLFELKPIRGRYCQNDFYMYQWLKPIRGRYCQNDFYMYK
jgi:hypothetical protein